MESLISDTTADVRMAGLENFLERRLGPRRPEFGASDEDVAAIAMPDPLQRLFKFAGRWPGHNPQTPYVNRFCMQDNLGGFVKKGYAPILQVMDDKLVFVWENQGCWVAATKRTGIDPPVWISENCSHRQPLQEWRHLDNPLSHFLVSFILLEVLFGSAILAVAPKALETFTAANLQVEPLWLEGEYAWDFARPSYFLVGEQFLVRRALREADEDDWIGSESTSSAKVLAELGLPCEI